MAEGPCANCSAPETRERALRSAVRHPTLKGSRFVGSRGVRDLYVCRQCGALWQTWLDQREDYRVWRAHPGSLVPVFAADTSVRRLVDWVASHYSVTSFRVVDVLARKLVRRRPVGLQEGTWVLLRSLYELTPPTSAMLAERIAMLFHLLGLVVERAIRGDLRPAGPRVKPPTRYRDTEVEEAARHFPLQSVDGLTRLPRTHDVIRRLMWEQRWREGAEKPDRAVIAIDDLSPVLRFLDELPLDVVDDGSLRGLYAEAAFEASGKLHDLGRLPENDHAIWMPPDAWQALEKLVDPLHRLAASFRRLREAAALAPAERALRFEMESLLVRESIRKGARFTPAARRELEQVDRQLSSGRGSDDARAHQALQRILLREKVAAEADARCVLRDA